MSKMLPPAGTLIGTGTLRVTVMSTGFGVMATSIGKKLTAATVAMTVLLTVAIFETVRSIELAM